MALPRGWVKTDLGSIADFVMGAGASGKCL